MNVEVDAKYKDLSTNEIVDIILECQKNPFKFIDEFIYIRGVSKGGVIPLILWDYQVDLLYQYLINKYVITLKPRQMGVSKITAAYCLWKALMNSHQEILLVSLNKAAAADMLKDIKFMYEHLPYFLQVPVNSSPRTLGTKTEIDFTNGSRIRAAAATENAGRSSTLSLFVMDEAAYQRNASAIWTAAHPTVEAGGQAIVISTAYGVGNFFHETYINAAAGNNHFYAAKLNWRQHPERDQVWYNEQLKNLGPKRVAQEVDCNFAKSGDTVFDIENIRAIDDRLRNQVYYEDAEGDMLKITHPPVPDMLYVIGVDISTDTGRDFSAFSVMSLDGIEVACFRGKVATYILSEILLRTAYRYNTAWIAPEANGVGESVIALAQAAHYPNIYSGISKLFNPTTLKAEMSDKLGWWQTQNSKLIITSELNDDINNGLVEINNPFFVEEAYNFVYDDKYTKVSALNKSKTSTAASQMYKDTVYTDDSVFALCIANAVRKLIPRLKYERYFHAFDLNKHLSDNIVVRDNYTHFICFSFTQSKLIYYKIQICEEQREIYLFGESITDIDDLEATMQTLAASMNSSITYMITGQPFTDYNTPYYKKIKMLLNIGNNEFKVRETDFNDANVRSYCNDLFALFKNVYVSTDSKTLALSLQKARIKDLSNLDDKLCIPVQGTTESIETAAMVEGFRAWVQYNRKLLVKLSETSY